MFKSLLLTVAAFGFLQPVFAGKVTIEADLNAKKSAKIKQRDPDTKHNSQGFGYYNISFNEKAKGLGYKSAYDSTNHKLVITGLTTDTIKEKIKLLNPGFSDSIDATTKSVGFPLDTFYTVYTTGQSQEEPKYKHSFWVTVNPNLEEDQIVQAELEQIKHCPANHHFMNPIGIPFSKKTPEQWEYGTF